MKFGPALDGPEPAADHCLELVEGGGGVVAQAALHHRPRAFDRVEVRGVTGQVDHGQPGLAGLGEGAHLPAAVGIEVVPDDNHRGSQGVVRGGDQVRVVGFGHARALALAPAVHAQAVEEPARPARLHARHARHRQPPGVPGDLHHGGVPAGRPGAGPARPQRLPGLVFEADPRAGQRREPRTFAQVAGRQAAIASSSRSNARCTGTCGEKPRRCSRNDTPRKV